MIEQRILTKKRLRVSLAVLFSVLSILCMAVIFSFSSQTGGTSGSLSLRILNWILENTPIVMTHHTLRKLAHFGIYALLGCMLSMALFFIRAKRGFFPQFVVGVGYAISDEIHQLLVSERVGAVTDILIDSFGVLVGALFVLALLTCLNSIIKRKRKKKNRYTGTPSIYKIM